MLGREVGEGAEPGAANELLDLAGVGAVVLTAGPRGMFATNRGGPGFHIPATAGPVVDVCGAGDAVAAVLTLAIGAGMGLETACKVASGAAGVVIGKPGTAECSIQELQARL